MRKFWGWVLFIVAWLDAGIIWYNLAIAPWKDDVDGDWVIIPYIAVLVACSFGWYRLAIRYHKEANNADKQR